MLKISLLDLQYKCLGFNFEKYHYFVKFTFIADDLMNDLIKLEDLSKFDMACNNIRNILTSMQIGLIDKEINDCIGLGSIYPILFFFENEKDATIFFESNVSEMRKYNDLFNWLLENKNGIIDSNT